MHLEHRINLMTRRNWPSYFRDNYRLINPRSFLSHKQLTPYLWRNGYFYIPSKALLGLDRFFAFKKKQKNILIYWGLSDPEVLVPASGSCRSALFHLMDWFFFFTVKKRIVHYLWLLGSVSSIYPSQTRVKNLKNLLKILESWKLKIDPCPG